MDALKTRQKINHCGPCSLAYALYLLTGKEIS